MLGVFLDTEANGLNATKHKVIEIAFKIIQLTTGKVHAGYHQVLFVSKEDWALSDPSSLHVNGFTWEDVAQGLDPKNVSNQIIDLFKKYSIVRNEAVFICQNPSFDRVYFSQLIPVELQEELNIPYHWLDLASMYWASAIKGSRGNTSSLPWETGYTKDKIAKHYDLGSEEMPHRAMNGVDHLIKCYEAVVGFPEKILSKEQVNL